MLNLEHIYRKQFESAPVHNAVLVGYARHDVCDECESCPGGETMFFSVLF